MEFLKRIHLDTLAGQDQPCQDATLRRIIPDFDWFTHDLVGSSCEKNRLEATPNYSSERLPTNWMGFSGRRENADVFVGFFSLLAIFTRRVS